MKTKEELNALKEEIKTLKRKLAELTGEELAQVCGSAALPDGIDIADTWPCRVCKSDQKVAAGPVVNGQYTFVCNRCGSLIDEEGYPIDPDILILR